MTDANRPHPSPGRDAGLLNVAAPAPTRKADRWRWVWTGRRDEPAPSRLGVLEDPAATAVGICCSGGGIRSAAFNLGALQELQEQERLATARYLAAVSGGSYIAAAFSMVAKTWTGTSRPDKGKTGHDDSDPSLVTEENGPFHPQSPEEQYLRNRASYLAPTGSDKLLLAFRVLLGLLFNIFFLGLLLFAAGIALGALVYRPWFGDLFGTASCEGAGECFRAAIPSGAWIALAVVGGAAVVMGLLLLLLRLRNDDLRWAIETWAVRLLVAEIVLAALVLMAPVLIEVVRDYVGNRSNAAPNTANTAKSPVIPAVGAGSVASLLLAVLLQLRAKAAMPADVLKGAKGFQAFLRKLGPRLRTAFAYLAGAIAGPLLLFSILLFGAVLALAHSDADGTSAAMWGVALAAVLVFAGLYASADLNSWSLHPFYRRRLCTAFALKRVKGADGRPEAAERDYGRLVPLSQSAVLPSNGTGWPMLIVCAAANVSDPGATPPGRGVTSFTFSPTAIGGPLVGAWPTLKYEAALGRNRQRDITLPAAVAMSGAAVSPSMGKMTRKPFTFLMALANVRLGVWVPNPRHLRNWSKAPKEIGPDGKAAGPRDIHKMPRPSYLFRELLGRNRLDGRYLYVTDGGHYENLGLVELLRRGCTTIYCFDASGGTSFEALGDAIALARSELGVEVTIELQDLVVTPDKPLAESDCTVGDILYPDGTPGHLVYARTVMTKALPWDVRAYHEADTTFPHTSTANQLYTDQKFEAYRTLGVWAARHGIAALDAKTAGARQHVADTAGAEPNGESATAAR